jgi:hypothetical protein
LEALGMKLELFVFRIVGKDAVRVWAESEKQARELAAQELCSNNTSQCAWLDKETVSCDRIEVPEKDVAGPAGIVLGDRDGLRQIGLRP